MNVKLTNVRPYFNGHFGNVRVTADIKYGNRKFFGIVMGRWSTAGLDKENAQYEFKDARHRVITDKIKINTFMPHMVVAATNAVKEEAPHQLMGEIHRLSLMVNTINAQLDAVRNAFELY